MVGGGMKVARVVLVLMVLGLFISSAFSQEDVIVLQHEELAPHERPIVGFTHEQHANIIECKRCHHEFDQYGNNIGGDGQPCWECHGRESEDGKVSLVDAFHMQCKSCHEDMLAKGMPTGPIMCGGCHVRN
jgi:hypothetical protein